MIIVKKPGILHNKYNEENEEKPIVDANSKVSEDFHGGDEITESVNDQRFAVDESNQNNQQSEEQNEEENQQQNSEDQQNNQQSSSDQQTQYDNNEDEQNKEENEQQQSEDEQTQQQTEQHQNSEEEQNEEQIENQNNVSDKDQQIEDQQNNQEQSSEEQNEEDEQDQQTEQQNNDNKETQQQTEQHQNSEQNNKENEQQLEEDNVSSDQQNEQQIKEEENNQNSEQHDNNEDEQNKEENDQQSSEEEEDNEENEQSSEDDEEDTSEDEEQEDATEYNSEEVAKISKKSRIMKKKLYLEFYRLIEYLADEEKVASPMPGQSVLLNTRKLMFRQYEHKPISSYYYYRARSQIILILDNSGSMEWLVEELNVFFSVALKRKDVQIYIAPNGNIEKYYDFRKRDFIEINHLDAIKQIRQSALPIVYVGDFDGANTPIELSWTNRIYWICPETRYKHFRSHDWVRYSEGAFKGFFGRAFNDEEIIEVLQQFSKNIMKQRFWYDNHDEKEFKDYYN